MNIITESDRHSFSQRTERQYTAYSRAVFTCTVLLRGLRKPPFYTLYTVIKCTLCYPSVDCSVLSIDWTVSPLFPCLHILIDDTQLSLAVWLCVMTLLGCIVCDNMTLCQPSNRVCCLCVQCCQGLAMCRLMYSAIGLLSTVLHLCLEKDPTVKLPKPLEVL